MSLPVVRSEYACIVRDETGTIMTVLACDDLVSLGWHVSCWFGGHAIPRELLVEGVEVVGEWTIETVVMVEKNNQMVKA